MTKYPLPFVFEKIWELQKELDLYGIDNVVLNDVASILYGIPKYISETRFLVSGENISNIVEAIVSVLGLRRYRQEILNTLDQKRRVAVNPLTMPVVYIVLADDEFTKECIKDSRVFEVDGLTYRTASIEAYIAYLLLKAKLYPYIIDGLTLLIVHAEKIDFDKLSKYGIERSSLCKLVLELDVLTSIFYEVNKHVKEIISTYCSNGR